MDIQSKPMRTTVSFTLSVLFHVSLVAGGAVLGAFFAQQKPSAPQAKGEQSYEITVAETQAEPAEVAQTEAATTEIAAPAEPTPPPPPVVTKTPAKPKADIAKVAPVKKAPAKKIMAIDFSDAQPAPQAVVEVNETLNEPTDTPEETLAAPQEEALVKSEEIVLDEAQEKESFKEQVRALEVEEIAEQKVADAQSEQTKAIEKIAPIATPAAGSPEGKSTNEGTAAAVSAPVAAAPATKEAPQNFLTLKQAPNNRPPSYPNELRLKQVQGKGQLKYYVNKDGRVGQMELVQSTGSAELDKVALESFSKYKFVPGQEGYTVHNFEFSLKGPAEPEARRLRTTYNK